MEMKQIILTFTLIVAVTAAILAYRFMVGDVRTEVAGADSADHAKSRSGAVPAGAETIPRAGPNRENGTVATTPGRVGHGLPGNDETFSRDEPAGVTPPVGMPADSRAAYTAEDTAEGGFTGNTAPDGNATPGANAAANENAPSGPGTAVLPPVVPGTGSASRVSGKDRAQNAVNSPSIDSPFLDKTYNDGRQYRPNAMQDYFADEPVEPENPVSEEKAGYYPEGRNKMKDVFRDLKK